MKNDLKKSHCIFLFSLLLVMFFILNNLYAQGNTMTITQEELQQLPVQRNVSDVLNLMPGVNTIGNQTFMNGSSAFNNNYMIDGVPVNDPLQTDQFMGLPFDAIQEIQVQTGGTDARYGRLAPGGVVNIITKSGGNKLSGSASVYFSPGALRYDLDQDTKDKNPIVVGDYFGSSSEYGFTLGGPIMKDKLWFYGSGSVKQGSTQTLFQDEIPQDYMDFSSGLKLNYQPNIQNQFELSYNYNNYHYNWEEDYMGYHHFDNDGYPRYMIRGNYHRICDDGWESNFQTSFSQFNRNYETGYNPSGTSSGLYGYDYTKDKTARSFDAHVDVLAPPFFCGDCQHQLGMGIGYQATCLDRMIESYERHGNIYTEPDYEYIDTWQYWKNYDHSAKMRDISMYIQDTITFGKLTAGCGIRYDKETFYWEGDTVKNKAIKDKTVYNWNLISPRVSMTYDITGDGKNVVQLNAGRYYQNNQYGYFEEAHPAGSSVAERYTAQINGEIIGDSDTTFFYPPLSTFGYDGYELKAPYMDEITIGLQRQMTEDWSLGIRYTKSWERNLIQTVDMSILDWDAFINDNKLEWTDYQSVDITNPYDNQPMVVFQDTTLDRIPMYTIVNPPGAKRDYDAIELTINKAYSHGWSMMASYTYCKSRGLVSTSDYEENYGLSSLYQNPNAQINADGLFDYAFPHQIKVHGTYDGPYGVQIGGSAKIFSGNPYAHQLSSVYPPLSDLPDGYGHIYAEKRGDSRLPAFWMLNLGLEKSFRVTDTTTATIFVDGYNITNNEVKLRVNPVVGSPGENEDIQRILNPGLFQFGVRVSF
ncbi:TonB-dependent receptor plug domain-containing protein [bacterium]|nr:TonB-dependent receptor plug domain-containing protein [bacterium]